MRKNYIEPEPLSLTPEKIEQIITELDHIERKLMPSIRKRLADAYEDGDMPENNPWLTANDDLQSSLKRRNELRHLLARVKSFEKLIQHKQSTAAGLGIGSIHTISINNGQPKTVTIVASEESDPTSDKISIDSPLGKALVCELSERFELQAPGGKVTITRYFE